jgi:hypothetical protein
VRLFELIRRRSGKTVPQFARALGYERQHWHRLESGLVQGKLLRTFARAVVEAGLSGEEVLELLKGVIAESSGGPSPSAGGDSARPPSSCDPRANQDHPDVSESLTQARRMGTLT